MYNYYPTVINPKSWFFKQTNIKKTIVKCVYETKTTVIIIAQFELLVVPAFKYIFYNVNTRGDNKKNDQCECQCNMAVPSKSLWLGYLYCQHFFQVMSLYFLRKYGNTTK